MPPKIDREDLLNDLRRVAEQVGGVPSYYDYQEHGEYSLRPIKDEFDGIVAAREAAGISEGSIHGVQVDQSELVEDLQRVADNLGRPPSWNEYDESGEYSAQLVYEKFGGFKAARETAGLHGGPTRPSRIARTELIRELQRVGREAGGCPAQADITSLGEYALKTYVRRFGSWANAVEAAGFEPNPTTPEGSDNPAWKGGNSHNYSSKSWRIQREKALERDNYECRACGMANKEHRQEYDRALDVHHIEPLRGFNEPKDGHGLDNLVTLCRPHHREYEPLPADAAKKLIG